MNKTDVLTTLSADVEAPIDRALELLAAGGFDYELVDRCPAACDFCDDELSEAA